MDYKRLSDDIADLVVARLNYFDEMPKLVGTDYSFDDALAAMNSGADRYRNDPIFRAKVMSLVADVMVAVRRNVERSNVANNATM